MSKNDMSAADREDASKLEQNTKNLSDCSNIIEVTYETFFEFETLHKEQAENYQDFYKRLLHHIIPEGVKDENLETGAKEDVMTIRLMNFIAFEWLRKINNELLQIVKAAYSTELRDNAQQLFQLVPKIASNIDSLLAKRPSASVNHRKRSIGFLKNSKDEKEKKGKKVSLTVQDPPPKVAGLHLQIMEKIKSTMLEHNLQLRGDKQSTDPQSSTLVTVVHSSRIEADIQRDMDSANISGSENVILLRIIPVNDPNKKVFKMKMDSFKLDLPFLVDNNAKTLYECEHNTSQCRELAEYLKGDQKYENKQLQRLSSVQND